MPPDGEPGERRSGRGTRRVAHGHPGRPAAESPLSGSGQHVVAQSSLAERRGHAQVVVVLRRAVVRA